MSLVLVCAAGVLSGCGTDQQDPVAAAPASGCRVDTTKPLALVTGNRANSAKPKVPEEVQKQISEAARNHVQLTLIRLDGNPKVVFDIPPPEVKKNTAADEKSTSDYRKVFAEAFTKKLSPETPEADVLRALSLGAQATPGGTVVVVDSGVQTVAPLDFTSDDLALAEAQEVADYLKGKGLLPDLGGRSVVLVNIGAVADPQPLLDNNLTRRVRNIWTAVVNAAGGCVVPYDGKPNTDPAATTTPPVKVMQLPAPPPNPTGCATVVFGQHEASFEADSATLVDPVSTRVLLQPVADVLRAEPGRHADLVGTTANQGSLAGQRTLSGQRADTIKGLLAELGVEAERISTRGAGSEDPSHEYDGGPDGPLLPAPAARNRKVIITISGCG